MYVKYIDFLYRYINLKYKYIDLEKTNYTPHKVNKKVIYKKFFYKS